MSPEDARILAMRRFGNVTLAKEDSRAVWGFICLEQLLQDIRYGVRQFRRAPGLFLAVVASLALGLGANTAIFTLIDAAVLRQLPVTDPEELVQLEWRNATMPGGTRGMECLGQARDADGLQLPCVPEPLFRAFADSQTEFVSLIGAGAPGEVTISTTSAAPAERTRALYVSANFFEGLGVATVLGRSFLPEDDRPGAAPAIVVSHRFWSARLGADPEAVGGTVRINDVPAQIVGVAPPGFFGLTVGEWIDVYAPLAGRRAFEPNAPAFAFGEANVGWIDPVARLAPGVSPFVAAAAVTPLFRNLLAETTGGEAEAGLELIARPAGRGLYTDSQDVSRALRTLMMLVGFLLLMVSVNVANLFLSRSIRRRRESAVRLALGAGRSRLVRQHLVESGLVAIIGGALGLGLGGVLARWIHAMFQTGRGPGSAFDVTVGWRVSAYATVMSLATVLIFGLAPAWTAMRSKVNDVLKVHSRSALSGGLGLGKALVSTQFALSFAALIAAGLLGQSFRNLYSTDLGFDPGGLAYAFVNPGQAGYAPDRIGPYLEQLGQELNAIPGVISVARLDALPLEGGNFTMAVNAPNGPPKYLDGIANPAAITTLVQGSAGFMEVLGMRLLAGRTLEANDAGLFGPGLAPVVVDERFAEVFFPGETPVGQTFGVTDDRDVLTHEVVGLVANTRFAGIRGPATPTMYASLTGVSGYFAMRARIDSGSLATAVQLAVSRVDPSVPLAEFHTQSGLVNRFLRTERLLALTSGAFSLAALLLAAMGLGGLLAYAVARRTNEIGIRMALGATGREVQRMVLGDSLKMVGAGVVIGVPLAYAVGRYMESLLFGLEPMDALTLLLALVALIVIALVASILPARRGAAVGPMMALREE